MKNEQEKGLWSNVTSVFSSKSNKNSITLNLLDSEDPETGDYTSLLKKNITQTIEVETSYKSFFIAIAIGIGLIFLSLIFLPMIAFAPQKFLMLFSLGSFITISSFIFIHGTTAYFSMLFSKERFIFTLVYVASLALSIYTSYLKESYILSLISVGIQVFSLIIFCLSFIPGGKTGINFLLSMAWTPASALLSKIRGK